MKKRDFLLSTALIISVFLSTAGVASDLIFNDDDMENQSPRSHVAHVPPNILDDLVLTASTLTGIFLGWTLSPFIIDYFQSEAKIAMHSDSYTLEIQVPGAVAGGVIGRVVGKAEIYASHKFAQFIYYLMKKCQGE